MGDVATSGLIYVCHAMHPAVVLSLSTRLPSELIVSYLYDRYLLAYCHEKSTDAVNKN